MAEHATAPHTAAAAAPAAPAHQAAAPARGDAAPPAPGAAARVTCAACPHACALAEGQRGLCQARVARGGAVVDESYGRVTALALDPIEKKPLARFRPGARILSVGSYGCNLRCPFCQNASIACAGPDDVDWRTCTPEELVEKADALRGRGNIGLAFTYNEPLVGYEFVRDCAALAHKRGLVAVLVSNGMANPGPLSELAGLIDAANIDLKGFTEDCYGQLGGNLAAVKATIATLAADPGCHLEVTTLVVPGMNDDPAHVDAMAAWLASLDPDIPYHVTRFFPCHRMAGAAPTPVPVVHALADVARRHLRHVFVGNC